MLLQRTIIFRGNRLPKNHIYNCDFPLEELNLEFKIDKEDYLINAVHIKSKQPKGLIFFLHGTLQHIQYHLPKATFFIENNYDVVMIDYPTYGKSKGKLIEANLYAIVSHSFDSLMELIKPTGNIILYGRSLGTAMASYLATLRKIDKLILVSPYYSMPDLFNSKLPLFPFKKLKFKFENHTHLQTVDCDTFIFHGTHDKLIPIQLSQKLIPYLKKEAHFIPIENANHFNVHEQEEYKQALKNLL